MYSERIYRFEKNVILHTSATENRRPLYRTRIRRRYNLALQWEDRRSVESTVAHKQHISRGRTGDVLWWWVDKPSLVILDDLLNDVYFKQVCDLFTRGSHHRNISFDFITQNLFHQGRCCKDILLNAHYLVAKKSSEIRSSSCTWPNNCTSKIVLGCITPTWMRHNDPTFTSS